MSASSDILVAEVGGIIGYKGKFKANHERQYHRGLYPKDKVGFGKLLYEYMRSIPIRKVDFTTFESLKEGKWYLVYMVDIGIKGYKFEGRPYALYYLYENKSRPVEGGFYLRHYGVKGMDTSRYRKFEEFFINSNYQKWGFGKDQIDDNKNFGFIPLEEPITFINWYRNNPFEVKS